MEEDIYVILGIVFSVLVIFFPTIKEEGAKENAAKSELHSRDRYAVAEGIQEELVKNTLVDKLSKNTGLKNVFQNDHQGRAKQTFCKKDSRSNTLMKNHSA